MSCGVQHLMDSCLCRYIDGSDLFELMSKHPDAFTDAVIRHFSASILSVLHFLHAPPDVMIFRDIKPENIMVTHEGYVKLIDFGIARRLASESSNADSQVCVERMPALMVWACRRLSYKVCLSNSEFLAPPLCRIILSGGCTQIVGIYLGRYPGVCSTRGVAWPGLRCVLHSVSCHSVN